MAFKVLLQKNDETDATIEYINILKEAVTQTYGIKDIPHIYDAKNITKEDVLIIISMQAILLNKLFFKPKQKFIYWFQGIVPEEVAYLYSSLYTKIKSFLFTQTEKYILKKAGLIFLVSKKLHGHYQKKYGYKKDNYLIIPCFNSRMDESYFTISKYEKPTFVYAGDLSKWQCFEETLLLFVKIKKILPEATLTILTHAQEEARILVEKHTISAEIKYVPLKDSSRELANYKYGFLIRNKNPINEVATPNKMSSYMAAGVIPVFTDAIGDFKAIFQPLKYVVTGTIDEPDAMVDRILEMEKHPVVLEQIINEYRSIFDTYYNRNKYIVEISEKLKGSCL